LSLSASLECKRINSICCCRGSSSRLNANVLTTFLYRCHAQQGHEDGLRTVTLNITQYNLLISNVSNVCVAGRILESPVVQWCW